MDQENKNESFVKFGGYDPEGFQDSNDIKILKTIDKESWKFQGISTSMTQGYKSNSGERFNQFIIEPAYPMIYIPTNLYKEYKNWLSIQNVFYNVEYMKNMIRFEMNCTEVLK